jgi:outer membrane protein assembly factor BamB
MYGFDIQTGEQLWKTSMPGYTQWGIWTKTNHLLKDDRLYVNEGGHQLHCLNPLDGSFIWQNLEDAPNCSDNMLYYEKEDYLVYTSWGLGSVMIVDALTGELVHQERSEDSTYNNDPVYDPETDMFFTSTYKNAVGFKINRPE